jgi:hypothetical protein
LLRKRAAVYDSLVAALVVNARIEVVDADLKFAIARAESLRSVRGSEEGAGRRFARALPEPGESPRAGASPSTSSGAPSETTAVQAPVTNQKADTNATD